MKNLLQLFFSWVGKKGPGDSSSKQSPPSIDGYTMNIISRTGNPIMKNMFYQKLQKGKNNDE